MNEERTAQAYSAAAELCEKANLKKGQILVVGCSSSEVCGDRIGTNSSLETAEAVFAEEDAYVRCVLDDATDLLFGDDGAARALGESPAYAVQLHYLEALPYSAAAVRLECTRGWAQHLAAKCLTWLDVHREPPARANRSL